MPNQYTKKAPVAGAKKKAVASSKKSTDIGAGMKVSAASRAKKSK